VNAESGAVQPSVRNARLVRFLGTGVLNTGFGYAVYALLVLLQLPLWMALLLATVAGVIFNYFSFGRMVFDGHMNLQVFGKFVLAYALIYAVNAGLLHWLTARWLLNPYLGQVLCIPFSVVLGWLLMNHWVYKKN
jgi:putative flippase GtrA